MDDLKVYRLLRCPSVRQHFQTSPLKPLGQLNSNFIWRLLRMRNKSLFTPIYGKTPFFLQNQKADDLGTWYVALGMWGLPGLFK